MINSSKVTGLRMVSHLIWGVPSKARLCQLREELRPGSPGQTLGTECGVVVGNGCSEAYTGR